MPLNHMCGIAGILSQNSEPRTDGSQNRKLIESELMPMINVQAHRGPDDWGVWSDRYCALGHRRLSIIDLSEAGRQPLSSADENLWITFNGEIYNYKQIRTELESLGHSFRTRTDTEVILYAYRQWGRDCLSRFRGMFAFGIWDREKRLLFLARDRVGKKPLFYMKLGSRFLFASELQGLLAYGVFPREVNLPAIDAYLSYGYIPAPQTAFKGIHKLPPAHSLSVTIEPEEIVTRLDRYWSLDYLPKLEMSEDEACQALREKMIDSVRLRMISDVPIGAFLSGGIDSSIVVGLMAKLSGSKVKTFSIGFEEASYNELDHARRIARKWDTEHHEFIVQSDALSVLPRLVRHYGEPYADSSAIPTFYVSQVTGRHVSVALNGDGGDESFAGYERYLGNYIAERLSAVPGLTTAARALSYIIPDSGNPKSRVRQAHRFLSVAKEPMAYRYQRWLTYFQDEMKEQLYNHEFVTEIKRQSDGLEDETTDRWLSALFHQLPRLDPIDAAMSVDIVSYLP